MTRTEGTARRSGLAWQWHDEQLVLLPERALWWPARETLFIADPHIGKAATFRATAMPIPDTTAADLTRLDATLEQSAATTLIILGDLLHARRGRCASTFALVEQWRGRWPQLHIKLVVGNHDRHAGPPPASWQMEPVAEPYSLAPFQLCHHPPTGELVGAPTLAGHLHPKFRLQTTSDRWTAPGFLLRRDVLILPAFGSFVDHLTMKPEPADRAFVIAEDEVREIRLA